MTDKELFKLALDALEKLWLLGDQAGTIANPAITALKERLAQEKALQALHSENERLGLYRDAYGEQEPFEDLAPELFAVAQISPADDGFSDTINRIETWLREHFLTPPPLTGGDDRRHIICLCPDCVAPQPQRTEPIQSLQCFHCQVTIETLNDKVISLLAERTKQKPAAWIYIDPNKPKVKFLEWKENEHGYRGTWIKKPLYLHPPQRTWQGLTDDEVKYEWVIWKASLPRYVGFAKGIEAKLKEKNT